MFACEQGGTFTTVAQQINTVTFLKPYRADSTVQFNRSPKWGTSGTSADSDAYSVGAWTLSTTGATFYTHSPVYLTNSMWTACGYVNG